MSEAAHEFHAGEREVQARAGVADSARRVARSIGREIPERAHEFLAAQRLAVLAAEDGAGSLWASPLIARPGFLRALGEDVLELGADLPPGDPLGSRFAEPRSVGVLVIDLAGRRRLRVNGSAWRTAGALRVATREVFWNCPKYITPREPPRELAHRARDTGTALTAEDQAQIASADTFFLATSHPAAGPDASHRGGPPGFVRASDSRHLTFPDYVGNAMFQSLGNLAVDPRVGLLFLDFATGASLQLSGRARTLWEGERAVEVTVERVHRAR